MSPRERMRLFVVALFAAGWAVASPLAARVVDPQLEAAALEPIVTEAIVNAPVDDVWKAWTTVEGMQSWMVAKGDIDLRVGGAWRTSYTRDADLAGDAAIHNVILAFDPGRMLAFQTVKPPRTFPFPTAIRQTWTVVYFEAVDAGRTRVTVRMLGYTDDPESRKMRAFFVNGNKATLDALVQKFR